MYNYVLNHDLNMNIVMWNIHGIYCYNWYRHGLWKYVHEWEILSQAMFQAWFMVFKHGNGLNSILIKYTYCKSYKWFIDIMHIDEYGFIRTCLWKKGFMVFYGFGSTEFSV